MNKQFINDIAPIIKDMRVWNAFVILINHQLDKTVAELEGKHSSDDLIRISAKYSLLQQLLKQQEIILNAEKSL